jgi:hypothetical protein
VKKDRRNILILFLILMVIVLTSYFLFVSGTTNKIKASLTKLTASVNDDASTGYYPVITMVINSSGERLVNEDVALTVMAESAYRIDKIYYSFDKENWYSDTYEADYGTEANIRLVFDETMDSAVYIKVENEMGYQSYAYETKVSIDKEKPKVSVIKNMDDITISATDNLGLSSIQYSTDGINWDDETVSGANVNMNKADFNYSFVRVVDTAGNISDVKEVK